MCCQGVGGGGGYDLKGDIHWRGDSYVKDGSGKGRVVPASASQGAACTTERSAVPGWGGDGGGGWGEEWGVMG